LEENKTELLMAEIWLDEANTSDGFQQVLGITVAKGMDRILRLKQNGKDEESHSARPKGTTRFLGHSEGRK